MVEIYQVGSENILKKCLKSTSDESLKIKTKPSYNVIISMVKYKQTNKTMRELETFFRTLLHVDTNFVIRKVYQYDTYPVYALLAKHNEKFFEEEWMEKFSNTFSMFQKSIEIVLQYHNLLDNKIAVVIEYQIPGFRNGTVGTILWCHKDFRDGFFLGCNPNVYAKDNLEIKFHL